MQPISAAVTGKWGLEYREGVASRPRQRIWEKEMKIKSHYRFQGLIFSLSIPTSFLTELLKSAKTT